MREEREEERGGERRREEEESTNKGITARDDTLERAGSEKKSGEPQGCAEQRKGYKSDRYRSTGMDIKMYKSRVQSKKKEYRCG